MTKLVIDSRISLVGVQDLPLQSVQTLKKHSSLPNPLYTRKLALRLPIWNTPKTIQLYENSQGGNVVTLHRGALLMVLSAIRAHGGKVHIEDKRCLKSTVEYARRPSLRDYQKGALSPSLEAEQGMLIAPAGSGKTEIGMALLAEIAQPALWLTHTTDLMDQALRRAKSSLGLEKHQLGTYGAGDKKLGTHLTVATVQTLSQMTDEQLTEFGKNFGAVIVDEAHRAAAGIKTMKSFERVLSFLPAYYRIGLTASEHRSDGLMESVYHIIGPKYFEIPREAIKEYLTKPAIRFVYTGWTWSFDKNEYARLPFSLMLSDMGKDATRNDIITRVILQQGEGQHNIILGDTLEGLQALFDLVSSKVGAALCAFVHGGTQRRERESIMAEMRKGTKRYLFATYALVKEGLDIPCLNRMYLSSPKKDRTVVEQSIGRVSRVSENKDGAIVYDFIDYHTVCHEQALARIKNVYKPQGCTLIGWRSSRTKNDTLTTLGTAFD